MEKKIITTPLPIENGTDGHSATPTASTTPLPSPEGDKKRQEGAYSYPRSVRGTMRVLNPNLDMEFRVTQSTGESNREELASTKGSMLYRTKGEKKQTLVAHLTTPSDSIDPMASMYSQLGKLEKDAKLETKTAKPMRGEKLHDKDGLLIILNKSKGMLQLHLDIDLAENPDYKDVFYKTITEITKCFSINQQKVVSAIPARPKSSQG